MPTNPRIATHPCRKDIEHAIRYPLKVGDVVDARPGYMVSHSHAATVTRIVDLGDNPFVPGGDWIELDGDRACMPRFKYIKRKR